MSCSINAWSLGGSGRGRVFAYGPTALITDARADIVLVPTADYLSGRIRRPLSSVATGGRSPGASEHDGKARTFPSLELDVVRRPCCVQHFAAVSPFDRYQGLAVQNQPEMNAHIWFALLDSQTLDLPCRAGRACLSVENAVTESPLDRADATVAASINAMVINCLGIMAFAIPESTGGNRSRPKTRRSGRPGSGRPRVR